MDFRITEDQELLLQSLEEHLQREAPENLMASLDDQKVFPYEPWKALADFGILALGVPEEYGGTPVDIMTMTLVTELLGREAFSLGIIYSLGVITIRDIVQFGSDEIKQKVLSGFVEGDAPVALGITEPQAGSDSAALKTSATFDGDDVIFNGQKMYCTLAGDQTLYHADDARSASRESLRGHFDVAAADRYSGRALQQNIKSRLVEYSHL
jgi:crotonobetainyl-CoA dehydrogenase